MLLELYNLFLAYPKISFGNCLYDSYALNGKVAHKGNNRNKGYSLFSALKREGYKWKKKKRIFY